MCSDNKIYRNHENLRIEELVNILLICLEFFFFYQYRVLNLLHYCMCGLHIHVEYYIVFIRSMQRQCSKWVPGCLKFPTLDHTFVEILYSMWGAREIRLDDFVCRLSFKYEKYFYPCAEFCNEIFCILSCSRQCFYFPIFI